ncbi:MAG: beta-galactosidase, partial [Boseongicola sp.]|nr:beta-galactosidase [Boseongicola sp.]
QNLLEGGGSFVHWSERVEGSADITIKTKNEHPALVSSGTLHYLAGWPDRTAWDRVLTLIAPAAGLYLEVLPQGLRVRDTATHRFAFNYAATPVHWRGIVIPPAGVHWVEI